LILQAWSTDFDGNMTHAEDNWELEVVSGAEASAHLASELANTASDEFLHDALSEWFSKGSIENLHEGNDVFWNVELTND